MNINFFMILLSVHTALSCKPSEAIEAKPLAKAGDAQGASGGSGAKSTASGGKTGATGASGSTDKPAGDDPAAAAPPPPIEVPDGADAALTASRSGYLFEPADVDQLGKLVLPFIDIKAQSDSSTVVAKYESYRIFIGKELETAMAGVKLKPGRSFTINVNDNESQNAAMGGDQVLLINTGLLETMSVDGFVATLCHEIAHSVRNHAYHSHKFFNESESSRDIETYVGKHYDTTKGEYKHDKAAYTKARKAWDAVAKDYGLAQKRRESEADVIGAVVCGKFGMAFDKYKQGIADLVSGTRFGGVVNKEGGSSATTGTNAPGANGPGAPAGEDDFPPPDSETVGPPEIFLAGDGSGDTDPKDLADGSTLKVPASDIIDILFPLAPDSHPTPEERTEQLERLRQKLQSANDFDAMFYKNMVAKLESGTSGADPTALGRVSGPAERKVTSSSGQVIRLHPPTGATQHIPLIVAP